MVGVSSFIVAIANIAFLLALVASIGFGIVFGHYWLRRGEKHATAFVSLSIYFLGCILILLFAFSTTNIGL